MDGPQSYKDLIKRSNWITPVMSDEIVAILEYVTLVHGLFTKSTI